MIRILYITLLCLYFSSCYTKRTAIRQVLRAQMEYPAVVAKGCAEWYPPRDSTVIQKEYIPGKDIIITDTVKVDCAEPGNIGKTIYVPYDKEVLRVDTYKYTVNKTVENTAKVSVLETDRDYYKKMLWLSVGIGSTLLILVFIISLIKFQNHGSKKA